MMLLCSFLFVPGFGLEANWTTEWFFQMLHTADNSPREFEFTKFYAHAMSNEALASSNGVLTSSNITRDVMIAMCSALGMNPVCDSTSFCDQDGFALMNSYKFSETYLRMQHNESTNVGYPYGFINIRHHWDAVCNYAGPYAPICDDANFGATAFICARQRTFAVMPPNNTVFDPPPCVEVHKPATSVKLMSELKITLQSAETLDCSDPAFQQACLDAIANTYATTDSSHNAPVTLTNCHIDSRRRALTSTRRLQASKSLYINYILEVNRESLSASSDLISSTSFDDELGRSLQENLAESSDPALQQITVDAIVSAEPKVIASSLEIAVGEACEAGGTCADSSQCMATAGQLGQACPGGNTQCLCTYTTLDDVIEANEKSTFLSLPLLLSIAINCLFMCAIIYWIRKRINRRGLEPAKTSKMKMEVPQAKASSCGESSPQERPEESPQKRPEVAAIHVQRRSTKYAESSRGGDTLISADAPEVEGTGAKRRVTRRSTRRSTKRNTQWITPGTAVADTTNPASEPGKKPVGRSTLVI